MTIVIQVPEYNDSFSRVVLGRKEYLIRFSYNDSGNYWTFGIYDGNRNPYVTGIPLTSSTCATDCRMEFLRRCLPKKGLNGMISGIKRRNLFLRR